MEICSCSESHNGCFRSTFQPSPFPPGQRLLVGQLRHRRISQPRKSERIRNLEVRIPIWCLVFLQQDLLICMIHMYQCNIPYDNGYFLFQHEFLIFMTHTYCNAHLNPYDVWFNIMCLPCICIQKYPTKQVQELQRNTFFG